MKEMTYLIAISLGTIILGGAFWWTKVDIKTGFISLLVGVLYALIGLGTMSLVDTFLVSTNPVVYYAGIAIIGTLLVFVPWPTRHEALGLSRLASIPTTIALALMTGLIPSKLLTWGLVKINLIPEEHWSLNFILSFFTLVIAGILLTHPKTRGKILQKTNDAGDVVETTFQSNIPPNHAGILLWLGGRVLIFFLWEGQHILPWWLGFSISDQPVPKTTLVHQEKDRVTGEMKAEVTDRGHYTPEEAVGYVYVGERRLQETLTVQAADLIPVTAAPDFTVVVKNPIEWQGGNNPLGTIIGRVEEASRIAISRNNAVDANAVRSFYPSLLMGASMLVIKTRTNANGLLKGDMVQDGAGNRITGKVDVDKPVTPETIQAYVDEVNARIPKGKTPAGTRPPGGFVPNMVEVLSVSQELKEETDRVGAAIVAIAMKDINVPGDASAAATQKLVEQQQRGAETFQAETAAQVAKTMQASLDETSKEAVEYMLVDRNKATGVMGMGKNPLAQIAAAFKG
jgi:hypothetical protein